MAGGQADQIGVILQMKWLRSWSGPRTELRVCALRE